MTDTPQAAKTEAGPEPALRRWSFGAAVLDERTQELMVGGAVVNVERKPLEVLLFLLHHAGEVVTKGECFEAVWPDRVVTEQVLTQCIKKLRDAIGDEQQDIIKTVHGHGYRLVAPVKVETFAAASPPRFDFKPGDSPPQRPHWSLVECLGSGGHGEVWLARHIKTREERVYKFALDESSLASLKREITVSRLLHDSLGERGDAFLRILDWNLDRPPYFIEAEHTSGGSLVKWADTQGGLARVPLATRLDIAIQIAEALATAHSVGVLHKDLKPSNVLIETKIPSSPKSTAAPHPNPLPIQKANGERELIRVRLCDFGSGGVLDPHRLDAMGITRMGFTQTVVADGTTSGTPVYFAPEVITGQVFTQQSDLYALGVVLYQLVAGDLKKPLAPGWELDVEDGLLREDIALAAAGNPLLRFKEATELAQRLRNLEQRRARRAAEKVITAPTIRTRTPLLAALLAGIVILGVLAAWRLFPVTPALPPSVALLPFTNLSSPENQYFSEGMTDELYAALGKIKGLRVVQMDDTPVSTDSPQGLRAIGQKLQVSVALAGSTRKSQDRVEISARLVSVADGKPLWSETYKRPLQDVFAIQEEIAQAAVQKLGVTLRPAPGRKLVDQGTSNVAAYDAYLKRAMTPRVDEPSIRRRIELSQAAVALDPEFARAHVALAYDYIARVFFVAPEDRAALKSGFAAAERALTINPQLAEAHVARGTLLMAPVNHYAYEPAIKEFKAALALNSKQGEAWQQLGSVYVYVGLFDEAQPAIQKAVELAPGNATRFLAAALLIWQGDYAKGLEAMERIPRKTNAPAWYWHSTWALLALGRLAEADARIEEFLKDQNDPGGLITSRRALLHALRGETAEAERDIQTAQNVDRRFWYFHRTAYGIASAYALMNRRAEALKWLDEALRPEGGFPCYPVPKRDPNLNNLRSEPEFQRIMERTRQLWEHYQQLARES